MKNRATNHHAVLPQIIGVSLLFAAASGQLAAQELTPAAYTPAPYGINLVSVASIYNTGDVTFDPAAPIAEASADIFAATLGYARTTKVAGRSANVAVILPYVTGSIEGLYRGEPASAHRSARGDLAARFAVIVAGAPALTPAEFRSYRPRTLVGVSLTVKMPTGQYNSRKLINIGTNRWSFKPEVGFVHVMGRWAIDAYLGVWLFTANPEFLGDLTRHQDPILSTEAHLRRTFGPRVWAAIDVNFWRGGQTTVNGQVNDDLQRNSRIGVTCAVKLGRQHSLRIAGSRGAVTRIGGDFDSIGVSYGFSWSDRRGTPR